MSIKWDLPAGPFKVTPTGRSLPVTHTFYLPKRQGGFIGVDMAIQQDHRCRRCHAKVLARNLDRHHASLECQLKTTMGEMRMQGYSAVKRQSLSILHDFKITYRERVYNDGSAMPYVWVEGWLGKVCSSLKSRPLRWTLQELSHNYVFRDAIESLGMLIDDPWAPVRFCKEQWESRKGKHRLSQISAERKHVPQEA